MVKRNGVEAANATADAATASAADAILAWSAVRAISQLTNNH